MTDKHCLGSFASTSNTLCVVRQGSFFTTDSLRSHMRWLSATTSRLLLHLGKAVLIRPLAHHKLRGRTCHLWCILEFNSATVHRWIEFSYNACSNRSPPPCSLIFSNTVHPWIELRYCDLSSATVNWVPRSCILESRHSDAQSLLSFVLSAILFIIYSW